MAFKCLVEALNSDSGLDKINCAKEIKKVRQYIEKLRPKVCNFTEPTKWVSNLS